MGVILEYEKKEKKGKRGGDEERLAMWFGEVYCGVCIFYLSLHQFLLELFINHS